jgi:hypothetical protein
MDKFPQRVMVPLKCSAIGYLLSAIRYYSSAKRRCGLNSSTNGGTANTGGASTDDNNRRNRSDPSNSPTHNSREPNNRVHNTPARKKRALGSESGKRNPSEPATIED